jgi:uncharacterized protein (TIGR03000 family)
MYSVILLAAMSTPADVPAWGPLFHRHSCSGCTGYSCGGCSGCSGACSGCSGYSCSGCTGYSCSGCSGGRVVAAYPYPGWGCGCCGGHFFGLRGGCWSTGGFRVYNACHGAGACWGYAYAGVSYGFAGCYGSCYGSYTNYFSYWAQPANVHYGFGMPIYPVPQFIPAGGHPADLPGGPAKPAAPPAKPAAPAKPGDAPKGVGAGAAAAVIVSLPADAILHANGVQMKQTGSERSFVTPDLAPGERFVYIFTAEINQGGQPIREMHQVEVEAGRETRVRFARLLAATSKESTDVASK